MYQKPIFDPKPLINKIIDLKLIKKNEGDMEDVR
jgi:hypothetical protein